MSRKHNVTGIYQLSIGTTKNGKGNPLTRYIVNTKNKKGEKISRSFYFGKNCLQNEAFFRACECLKEAGQPIPSKANLKEIYKANQHESIL